MTPPETPPPAATDAELALERWRTTTRELLAGGDSRSALSAAVSGLTIDGSDTELLQALQQIEAQARRNALTARTVAGTTQSGAPSYAEGERAMEIAQRHATNRRPEDAISSYWRAEELFKAARAETPPAPPAPEPAPPAPPVAERETPPAAPAPPAPAVAEAAAPEAGPAPTTPDTPPVAATPPPAVPARDDDAQIRAALAAYAQAYRNLDVQAVAIVFPTVDTEALSTAFERLRSQDMQIGNPAITISGDRATVVADVHTTIQPTNRQSVPPSRQRAEFTLQRSGDRWVIVQRR